jgi:hypothetical protein
MAAYDPRLSKKAELPSHVPGSVRGEETVIKHGREPGCTHPQIGRTARDSTSINPAKHGPIDPRMPHIPPA